MPASDWLRRDLSGILRSVLQSKSFADRNWIRPESVNRMVDEHSSMARDWGEQLWTLLVLELWARVALDKTIVREMPLHAVA